MRVPGSSTLIKTRASPIDRDLPGVIKKSVIKTSLINNDAVLLKIAPNYSVCESGL
jgi:hypothetical protein